MSKSGADTRVVTAVEVSLGVFETEDLALRQALSGTVAQASLSFIERGADRARQLFFYGAMAEQSARAHAEKHILPNKDDDRSRYSDVTLTLIYARVEKLAVQPRAAYRHGRTAPGDAIYGSTCSGCLHVGCRGNCHAQEGKDA